MKTYLHTDELLHYEGCCLVEQIRSLFIGRDAPLNKEHLFFFLFDMPCSNVISVEWWPKKLISYES